MTMTDPDLADEATQPIDGAEPAITHAEVLDPEPTALARPDVRPSHHGDRLIAGTDLPVVPATNELDGLAQMAVTLSAAAAVPKAMQNRPNDVFLVLLTARDLGVGLTTALREFHVIEGKVTISPKAKLAMVRQQGLGRIWPDPANDGDGATWYAERADQPGVRHQSTFTAEMARAANLLPGKDKSAWKTYPERMLSWRACGYLLDDVFGEVGTGLYSPDELGAITDDDGELVIDVVGHAQPLPGTSAPRGHQRQQIAEPEPVADQADLDGLQARIEALAVLPDARAALVALWTAPRTDASGAELGPALPPLKHLMAKQVKMADAMIASIEARARKGEWGDWSPEPAQEPQDRPEAPDEGQDAPADPEPVAEPTVADEGAQVVALVIAEVKAMEPETVAEQLATRELDTEGRLDTLRHRLATAMIGERQPTQAG